MEIKSFLLIYSELATGGVETLIVRMANWLVFHDFKVKILLYKKSDLDHLLDQKVEIKYLGLKYFLLFEPNYNKRYVRSAFFTNIDVIYSYEATTCLLASLIHKNMSHKPIFLTGVYQPYEYNPNSYKYLRGFYHEMIIKMVPSNSVLFMNSSCKRSVMKNVNKDFEKSRYFILPVNIKPANKSSERRPDKLKIISIGRIVDFKTYNFHMIDVIKKMKNENYEIYYDIYGEGPQKNEIIDKIAELKLESNVCLKGKLKYENMPIVLKDAYIFLGMGTAVIEASMCGVPSIVAIVLNHKPTCYGFYFNQKNDNLGEIDDGMIEISLEGIIKESLAWTNDQYKEASEKSIEYSKKHYIDDVMSEFIYKLKIENTNQLNYLSSRFYEKYFIGYIFLRLVKKIVVNVKRMARSRYATL